MRTDIHRPRRNTPWARIYYAGLRGTGLRLSAEEVQQLMGDGALTEVGHRDYKGDDEGPCNAE